MRIFEKLRGMASSPPVQTIIYFLIVIQLRYITVQSFTLLHHISHSHLFHWQLSTRYHENSLCLLPFFACSLRRYWYVLHSSYFTLFSLFLFIYFYFFWDCIFISLHTKENLKSNHFFVLQKPRSSSLFIRAVSHYFKNQEKYIILY